jgi:hypothetical protein
VSFTRVTSPNDRPGASTFTGLIIGIGALTLVIAGGNANTLLLGLAGRRQREMSIKTAIGATRGHLIRALIVESLAIACLAAAIGWGLANTSFVWLGQLDTSRILPSMYPGILLDWRADGRILLVAFGMMLTIGIAVGVRYAMHATSFEIASLIKAGTPAGRPGKAFSRRALVFVELAIATAVVAVSAQLFETVRNLATAQTGLAVNHLFSVDMELGRKGYTTTTGPVMYRRLRDQLAQIAEVETVTLAVAPPLGDPHLRTAHPSIAGDAALQRGRLASSARSRLCWCCLESSYRSSRP